MEMAQFGDTEVASTELKSTWHQLIDNAGKTLELEFARLANMVDDRKGGFLSEFEVVIVKSSKTSVTIVALSFL